MYYKKDYGEVIEQLKSYPEGLSEESAQKRIKELGYNEIKEGEKTPIWKMFLESFKDPLVIILLIAAVIQGIVGEWIESIIIFVVVILNAVLGVTQTRKAESSLNSLKKLSAPNAKVLRDNKKITIAARELVVGDMVFLEAGDYIPADGRLVEAQTLKVVEGMLTGEAEAVLKSTDIIEKEVGIGDQHNMVFSGATVVYGRGKYIVTHTGMNTEMGKVATLLETAGNKQTPLQNKLDDFGKKLGFLIMGLALFIFAIQVIRGYINKVEMQGLILDSFMFAVAVAVAAIPEALSSIVTIVLAVGTKDMAKRRAIVRKLPAVETLGSTSVICTDKTGTLTQNKMTVVDFFMYGIEGGKKKIEEKFAEKEEGFELDEKGLAIEATLCNDAEVSHTGAEIGDPTEVALLHYATKRGLDYKILREKYDRLSEIPFDSDRKLMSTVNDIHGNAMMFTKGAPDVVLDRCKGVIDQGEEVPLTKAYIDEFMKKNHDFADRALRVLAFAVKDVPDQNFIPCLEDEKDMVLVGLMAMIDPPREEVFAAVKEAKVAGIKTVMITGDHKTTAVAIAKEIGIMEEGNIAYTGQELDALSEEVLDKELENIRVYARVSPENKIRIVKAWQRKGNITAMTGDGVNDAPALKQANIGIGMGSGTDVAKDASAMILTDDNFATIVSAIEVGRTVYSNIKKAITYLFAGNLAAIIAILFAVAIGWANPFTALQLLFINLINDSLPAIALGLEPAEKNIMNEKPRNIQEGILAGGTWQTILIRGILIGILVIIAQFIGNQTSVELGAAMAFSTITLARILQTLPSRSNHFMVHKLGLLTNKYVLGAIGICLVVYALVLIPGIRTVFSIPDSFAMMQFLICLGLALIATIGMEIMKIWTKNFK